MSPVPRARPTIYRGVQYRSRLEATWAAFFDLAGMKVWYENREDLAGWIPDFEAETPHVHGSGERFLVEVKPAYALADFAGAIGKARVSGYCGYVLFAGVDLDASCLWFFEPGYDAQRGPWGMALGLTVADPRPLWAAAQNATQWRAPR